MENSKNYAKTSTRESASLTRHMIVLNILGPFRLMTLRSLLECASHSMEYVLEAKQ